ncbi:hypothetical protein Hdeb2414_s0016g00474011 [Helianthus debilis subsp. tardiflorus]
MVKMLLKNIWTQFCIIVCIAYSSFINIELQFAKYLKLHNIISSLPLTPTHLKSYGF